MIFTVHYDNPDDPSEKTSVTVDQFDPILEISDELALGGEPYIRVDGHRLTIKVANGEAKYLWQHMVSRQGTAESWTQIDRYKLIQHIMYQGKEGA